MKVSCHTKFRFAEREAQCILGECGPLSSLKIMAELLEYGAAISVTLLVFQETSSFSVASLVTEIDYFIAEESSTISSLNLVNF